jgi:hypothetical protein
MERIVYLNRKPNSEGVVAQPPMGVAASHKLFVDGKRVQ